VVERCQMMPMTGIPAVIRWTDYLIGGFFVIFG
jgi:hypothetical protein